jgi:hypothetical protein
MVKHKCDDLCCHDLEEDDEQQNNTNHSLIISLIGFMFISVGVSYYILGNEYMIIVCGLLLIFSIFTLIK